MHDFFLIQPNFLNIDSQTVTFFFECEIFLLPLIRRRIGLLVQNPEANVDSSKGFRT